MRAAPFVISALPPRAESVRKIVTCPLYIGYYRFKGELYKGNFEPIVSEALWKKAQRIRQRTARKK